MLVSFSGLIKRLAEGFHGFDLLQSVRKVGFIDFVHKKLTNAKNGYGYQKGNTDKR